MLFPVFSMMFNLLTSVHFIEATMSGAQSSSPKFVMSVDGKSFFADKTVSRNWAAAGEYCNGAGMKLAEITSATQVSALQSAYSEDFYWEHWTAGRDVQDVKQFCWNKSGQAVSSEYLELQLQVPVPYQTCLIYMSLPNNESGLRYWPCEDGDFAGVLCEVADNYNSNLKLIAKADGKSFYADKSIPRNWTAAGEYCESVGMKLAEITSPNQVSALKSAYSSSAFKWEHWIAGRDAQDINQFCWNKTEKALDPEFIELQPQIPFAYQTCVLYISLPNNESGLRFWPCDDGTFAGVICQSDGT